MALLLTGWVFDPSVTAVACVKLQPPMRMSMDLRKTSKRELDEVIAYWQSCPRCSGHLEEASLIKFLEIFTPHQIKGAMYLATSAGRPNYFKYLCGILHNWRRDLESGVTPRYFDISE